MKKSISGFKQRGSWRAIVEHGERVTNALQEVGVGEEYAESFEEWVEWRPKHHETLGSDVSEKTAEQAATDPSDTAANEELQKAGEELANSYEKLSDNKPDEVPSKWRESASHVKNAVDSAGKQALETVEKTVYEKVMTRISPYYFDNELVSANIAYKRSQEEFVFEINVNDDELLAAVESVLDTLDETVDRWHVNTEKEVETVEAVEGVEAPKQSKEPDEDHPQPDVT